MKSQDLIPLAFFGAVAAVPFFFDEAPMHRAAMPDGLPIAQAHATAPSHGPAVTLAPARWIPVDESLLANETVVAPVASAPASPPALRRVNDAPGLLDPPRVTGPRQAVQAPQRNAAPVESRRVPAREVRQAAPAPKSRIEVQAPRYGGDRGLQRAAMEAIGRMPNVTGQVRVEARDSVIRLSGWTLTSGQSQRVEKVARRVNGVRAVVNEIRPRVGAITS